MLDFLNNKEVTAFYNKKHKAFFQLLKTKFNALCYMVIYVSCAQITISDIFSGSMNTFIESNFKLSKLINSGKPSIFTDLNQEIVNYLLINVSFG